MDPSGGGTGADASLVLAACLPLLEQHAFHCLRIAEHALLCGVERDASAAGALDSGATICRGFGSRSRDGVSGVENSAFFKLLDNVAFFVCELLDFFNNSKV